MGNQTNTDCTESFIAHKVAVEDLLDAIATRVSDHLGHSPDSLHWGHAGTMAAIEEKLKEVALFMGLDSAE